MKINLLYTITIATAFSYLHIHAMEHHQQQLTLQIQDSGYQSLYQSLPHSDDENKITETIIPIDNCKTIKIKPSPKIPLITTQQKNTSINTEHVIAARYTGEILCAYSNTQEGRSIRCTNEGKMVCAGITCVGLVVAIFITMASTMGQVNLH